MADDRFEALHDKPRNYWDKLTNEKISRREWQSRSGRLSFEQIRDINQAKPGYINPQSKYNIIVEQFKVVTAKKLDILPSEVRVRGNSDTAVLLKNIVNILKNEDAYPEKVRDAVLDYMEMTQREYVSYIAS